MHLSAEQTDGRLPLRLTGNWRALDIAALRADMAAVPLEHVREIAIDARGAERLDLSGAWLLREFLDAAAAGGARRTGFVGESPAQLALIDRTRAGEADAAVVRDIIARSQECNRLHLAWVSESVEQKAWELFTQHPGLKLSLTDCTSAVLSAGLKLPRWTDDSDFAALGCRVWPD